MKIPQFTEIIWNTLVARSNNRNFWKVSKDFVAEWSMHSSEFQFMKVFKERNHSEIADDFDTDCQRRELSKIKVTKYHGYGRTFKVSCYCMGNTQFMMIDRDSLIAIYDYFVDDAQSMKVERYGKLATPRRPYFKERFEESETFLEWFNDSSRQHGVRCR